VSELPETWTVLTFDEICSKISDGTHHSPKIQHQEAAPGRFKYVTSKNVRPWGLDLDSLTYVDESVHREIYARCNPEFGDVLLTKDGVNTGVVAINSLREEFSLLSSVALLKIKPALVEGRFLKHYIASPDGNRALLGTMTGTAIRRIILRGIKEATIPVPPLAEQKRIVAKIEELFSELEAGEASLRKARRQLGVYRQSLLKQAFEGKLTQ
jgi:type I restriction enzyme S subunit